MGQFDRYILSQLVTIFGFFSLVLISVYWVNEAVDLFDSLIADGQTFAVFLEFTALALPQIMILVLPISAFVATLYIMNRLIAESEMVILQTSGVSALRLARPVFYFGLLLALLIAILGNVLAPAARGQFIDRSQDVRQDLTGRFLRSGQFIHPADGLTVYIEEITERGEFLNLFLQDRSDPRAETTYHANRALLVRGTSGPRLVMFNGMAQTLYLGTGRLATVSFQDFTYALDGVIGGDDLRTFAIRELPTRTLITADAELAEQLDLSLARMLFEGHDRIARALFVIFPPLIAAGCLMLGSVSRFGVWPQILLAVFLVIPLQMIWNAAEAAALRDSTLYYLAYAQPLSAALGAGVLLGLAMLNRRPWRRMVPS